MYKEDIIRGFRDSRRAFCNTCQVGNFTSLESLKYREGVITGYMLILEKMHYITEKEVIDTQVKLSYAVQYYKDRMKRGGIVGFKK